LSGCGTTQHIKNIKSGSPPDESRQKKEEKEVSCHHMIFFYFHLSKNVKSFSCRNFSPQLKLSQYFIFFYYWQNSKSLVEGKITRANFPVLQKLFALTILRGELWHFYSG
jgi:hypothetical protein